ncbi:hypothetical protein [Ferruginibacter sp.]|uniref:hypothetical protein n=1 Tax=Ferruginibacter sp. TaxID=1940288 RepID=UPI002657C065|nr:hypothetical protein [Ferruginibacter sp.]
MKINRFTVLLAAILLIGNVNAQTKVARFCKISIAQEKRGVEVINIDYGAAENYAVFNDSLITTNLEKVKLTSNQLDAFNYMGSLGWECISIVSVIPQYHGFPYDKFVCIFKKVFTKEDMH